MDTNTTTQGHVLTCSGNTLIKLARAGMAWLQANHAHVNSLNVFPVPDGDTGTNMLLTMRSAWREIENLNSNHAGYIAQKIYNGALMGARGNSGVILSQLWRGFAKGMDGHEIITAKVLALSFQEASKSAYSAVQEPVEGTMLTVAREMAEEVNLAAGETDDLADILARAVERGHQAVARTPELLSVLKDAGVVDSGGMGLVYIIEGALRHVNGDYIPYEDGEQAQTNRPDSVHLTEENLENPYDVQFLIKGKGLDVNRIRREIEAMGDSGVIVGDPNLVKVHIHVVNPGVPISYGAELGALLDVVIENMQEQYHDFVANRDSTGHELADVEPPKLDPESIGVVTVSPGDGFKNIFYSLGAGHVIAGGQTMNPSTAQIVEAVNDLPTSRVVILPNNKNILMAAEQAAEQITDKQVRVIATHTIPQGISALLALDPYGDLQDVVSEMQQSSMMVETGEITTATRNATVNGLKVKEGESIGLHNDKLVVTGDNVPSVMYSLLDRMEAERYELITLYYGAGITRDEAEKVVKSLEELYPDHEIELRFGGQAHYYYILSVE